ncbi:ankyrin repeat domain-containing protein [Arthrobacter roseus]|uniref:ankyrin repeat domain-containing protein n=1 Tax=Arthrobacter roseus TaxID=136274 RepID=UPI001963E4FD|nr:ankyrin repeat domain-containing protein [Arthrobacter roseus]MBM7849357.1 ankyrin repeat protein [Arthrobacter roseus]
MAAEDAREDAALELAQRLFDAAREGHTDTLTRYVSAGVPATMTNASGDSLLMLAAYHGHADTVGVLLEAGAEPDSLNDRGQTPLAGAVFKGYRDVVAALVAAGADPDAGTPTARASAEYFGKLDMLELLG